METGYQPTPQGFQPWMLENLTVERPGYFIKLKKPFQYFITLGIYADIIAQIDITVSDNLTGYGGLFLCMQTDSYDRYEFVISPRSGTYAISKRYKDQNSILVPFTNSPIIKTGLDQINRVMVEIHRGEITAYANGYFLAKVTDTFLGPGAVGFTAASNVGGPRFLFQNFKLK